MDIFSKITAAVEATSDAVWGLPLIHLLIGTGLYLTFRLVFIQVRYFSFGVRIALGLADREEDKRSEQQPKRDGDISYFQALTTALSATIGIGNIQYRISSVINTSRESSA